MEQANPKIDVYIANSADFAKPILTHLRILVHEVCPEVEEGWKWSFPHFMYKGAILCSMAAFKEHCSFGFWKSALMEDPDNLFTKQERDGMGHFGKIHSLQDLPKDAILKKYIKAAMKLNEDCIKLPPKKKAATTEIETPSYFAEALNEHPKAKAVFEAYSYSHKKEYIEWIVEAKTEPTRNKRMAQAIEWLSEGKSRHWKY